jgi:hypothetical protein
MEAGNAEWQYPRAGFYDGSVMSLKSKIGARVAFACLSVEGAAVAASTNVKAAEEGENKSTSMTRDGGLELIEAD